MTDGALPHGARRDGDDLVLAVRVVPKASRDDVLAEAQWLKIRVTAPPVDGKANEHLVRLLARVFGVAKSRVVIEKGATGRSKQVRIVRPERLPAFLA